MVSKGRDRRPIRLDHAVNSKLIFLLKLANGIVCFSVIVAERPPLRQPKVPCAGEEGLHFSNIGSVIVRTARANNPVKLVDAVAEKFLKASARFPCLLKSSWPWIVILIEQAFLLNPPFSPLLRRVRKSIGVPALQ